MTRLYEPSLKHGHTRNTKPTPTYISWANMMARCRAVSGANYRNYGSRGIVVCERWAKFENFLTDMGERPDGTSIDRIDNDGNYDPGNCRWTDISTQIGNRRRSRYLEAFGRRQTLTEWARELGINRSSLIERLRKWPQDKALSTGALR